MEDRLPRKLAAILYADVAGYSRLTGEDEDATHRTLSEYLDLISSTIESHRGQVMHYAGDAVLAKFDAVVDALSCAVAIQTDLRTRNQNLPDERRVQFRIGVNLGDVIEDRGDIYGDGVNVAARLESLAEPGGICISESVRTAVGKKLPLDYEPMGEQRVKNIAEPVKAYHAWLRPGEVLPAPTARAKSRRPMRHLIAASAAAVVLVIGTTVIMWLKPWAPTVEPASVERMVFPLPDKPSIAVLPFDNLSGDPEQQYFADGLTEDIITELSRFGDLFVIARTSVFTYKDKPAKVQRVAEELGVRYVLEGSVRRMENRLRVTAQLIDATTGHHLWSERYDRELQDLFRVQDEITQTIVASLGGGIVAGADLKRAKHKGTTNLKAYDYFLLGNDRHRRWTKNDNAKSRELYEKAIELDPEYARAYVQLAWTHFNDWWLGWSETPDVSAKQAFESAKRAVELDNAEAEAHWVLGSVYINIKKQPKAGIAAYERALALNPNHADIIAVWGWDLPIVGRAEEGVAAIKKAMRLNPNHPTWYKYALAYSLYSARHYQEVVSLAETIENRILSTHLVLAGSYAQLGELDKAKAEAAKALEKQPEFSISSWSKTQSFIDPADLEHYLDGLRKAGLPENPPLALPEKPSIAVLPFANMSDDPKQEYFVDGMTEDLITDLSKLSGLFVIARSSSFAYKGKSPDMRQVSRELGVKYVLEGSVRRAGEQVRINAQLIDATTGGHVWAERYDGDLEDVFDLQDRITRKIVTALAVELTEGQQAATAKRGTNNVEAYDLFMKGWALYRTDTPRGFIEAIPYFERAVTLDPDYGRAYAALASVYYVGYWRNWGRSFEVLPNFPKYPNDEAAFIRRAFENLDKSLRTPNPLAYVLESETLLHKPDHSEAMVAAERAIALNPNGPDGYVQLARVLTMVGQPEEAVALVEKAMRLNPYYPPSYLAVLGLAYFGLEDYERAALLTEQAMKLSPYLNPLPLIASLGYLDEKEKAAPVIENLRQRLNEQLPGYPATIRVLVHWRFPLFEHSTDRERLNEGLRRAGLS